MDSIRYLDFDLQIERAGEGYRVNVLASPAGQASSDFVLPFSDLELENFVLRMSRTRRATRRLGTPELEAARTFGGRLYEAVFAGEVRGCLRSSLDAAGREGGGLRLRLRLTETPELVDLPWEYLYSPALNRFFALSNTTPLIRYLDLPQPVAPLNVQPPLRLLALIASPRDFPALDVEQEWENLRSALKELEDAGRITLERLQPATLSALQRRLRAGPCHILHFIGHGAFDEATQDGQLLLEDRDGRGHVISAQDLGVLLHDHHSMRLVMLNACEGARTSRTDPFAGAAQSLVQQGMPAVVAMQFEISDDTAIVIGHEFYSALAAGYPVDAALAEARKAAFTSASGAEWGTPVLYLRAPDGRIFGMDAPPVAPAPQAAQQKPVPVPRVAPRPKLLWLLGGLLAVLALALGLSRLLPGLQRAAEPGAGATVTSAPPAAAPAAELTVTAAGAGNGGATQGSTSQARPAAADARSIDQLVREAPRVLSTTAWVHDLIPADEGVWAGTGGGLVRWKAGGTGTVFTSADGLPFNRTRALLAMPDGSFWAAGDYAVVHITPEGDTLGAVERYSGAEGVEFGQSPVLMLDHDGSVWLSTLYGRSPIERFDGTFWRPPDLPADDPALANVEPHIATMTRGKDGALWLGLDKAGVLRWDGQAWAYFGDEQGLSPADNVKRVLEDADGTVWAAAGEAGLLRFDRASETWRRVEFQRADAPVYWISQLPDNSLWASGDNFIARSDDGGTRWRLAATPEDNLYFPGAVVQDGTQAVWAATANGLARYDGQAWLTLHRRGELTAFNLGQVVPAPDGKVWVVPLYGGLPSVVDPDTGEAAWPDQWSPSSPPVTSVAFGGGATWLGRRDGLLRMKDGALNLLSEAHGLADPRVSVLLATADALWIGTPSGLVTLDFETERFSETVEALDGQSVDVLTVAPDGAIWAGTHWEKQDGSSAIYRISGGTAQQAGPDAGPPLNGRWATALAASENGEVWVSSGEGVYRWDGRAWLSWADAQDPPRSEIYALLAHDGAMWSAGHSGMIHRWHPDDGWKHIVPRGLTADVWDMEVTGDGALWLATGDGLLRYGP